MLDVFSTPDHSKPCGAVATFDAAIESDDLERAISDMRFEYPRGETTFRDKVDELGIEWFRRKCGRYWRYKRRTEESCVVERYGYLDNGSLVVDEFNTTLIENEWRITKAPSSQVRTIHSELGPIHFDGYAWEVYRYVLALGYVVAIRMPGNELGPQQIHVDAVSKLCSHEVVERAAICERLLSYYEENIVGWFSVHDDDGIDVTEHYVPKITKAEDLWDMLWPPVVIRISEDLSDDSPWHFTIDTECLWDSEHGLGIRLKGWKVIEFCGNSD